MSRALMTVLTSKTKDADSCKLLFVKEGDLNGFPKG